MGAIRTELIVKVAGPTGCARLFGCSVREEAAQCYSSEDREGEDKSQQMSFAASHCGSSQGVIWLHLDLTALGGRDGLAGARRGLTPRRRHSGGGEEHGSTVRSLTESSVLGGQREWSTEVAWGRTSIMYESQRYVFYFL